MAEVAQMRLGGIWFDLQGAPRTKKNHQRLVNVRGRMIPIQSAQYKDYEKSCLSQIAAMRHDLMQLEHLPILGKINLCCVYYMPTHRRVDLVNLLEATCDILVRAGILADDNADIVAAHDGSRVLYDKARPRVEIQIKELGE